MKNKYISLNINYLLSKENVGKDAFGKLFGLNRGAIGSYIDGKSRPKIETLQKISEKYNLTLDDLVNGDLSQKAQQPVAPVGEAQPIPVKYKKVPVIPVHAQAGFLSGYGDEAYWGGLPTEVWEVDQEYKGHYVVFEVRGDSMDDNSVEAILDGDRILCREIQRHHWGSKLHINKWNFVIAHREAGIIVKRIVEHNVESGVLTCHSLNPYYEDFEIDLNDVIALFNVVDLKRNLRL
ncbi:MAG: LexA family transcriptional regulator [Bacteroidota bacterium]